MLPLPSHWLDNGMMKVLTNSNARLATMVVLRETLLPNFLDPIPTNETLRNWFDEARVPRFKSNPLAKRGGGPVFYQVAAVEKLLRTKLLPGRLAPRPNPQSPTRATD